MRHAWFALLGVAGGLGGCVSKGDTTVNAGPHTGGSGGATGSGSGGTSGSAGAGAGTDGSGAASGSSGDGGSGTGGSAGGASGGSGGSGPAAPCIDNTCSEFCKDCDDDGTCETAVTSANDCGACERQCNCEPIQAACTGSSVPTVVSATGYSYQSIALGGSWIYLQRGSEAFRKDTLAAGNPTTITLSGASGAWRGIATDTQYAYFVSPGGVFRVSHQQDPTPAGEPIGSFSGVTPVATFSPIVANGFLYFAFGTSSGGEIDGVAVGKLDLGASLPATVELEAGIDGTAYIHINMIPESHVPTVAVDANTNVFLCMPTPPAVRASGKNLGPSNEACAGAAVVGGNLYYRGWDPQESGQSLADAYHTQLYRLPTGGTTPTAVGPPHHAAHATQVVARGTSLFYCGYDATDTAPGLAAGSFPWVVFRHDTAGNLLTRIAAGSANGMDCSDIAAAPTGTDVYFSIYQSSVFRVDGGS